MNQKQAIQIGRRINNYLSTLEKIRDSELTSNKKIQQLLDKEIKRFGEIYQVELKAYEQHLGGEKQLRGRKA